MPLAPETPHPPGTNTVAFHRKQFLAERVGWVVMALILGWALLGGFGEGWLSHGGATNEAATLQADYQRFARRDSPVDLKIRLRHAPLQDGAVLHLNREFVDRVKIERVTPMYRAMTADRDGLSLDFDVEQSAVECPITIEYKPRHIGPLHAVISAEGAAAAAFDQFIYP